MSGMNALLSSYYGTGPSRQDAELEFFAKTAAAQGIDLSQMSDAQVNYLWNNTFNKTAGEEEAIQELVEQGLTPEQAEQVLEEAVQEYEEKKESMAKIAEHDYLGRVMAHAYANELQKIADGEVPAEGVAAVVDAAAKAKLWDRVKDGVGGAYDSVKGGLGKGYEGVKGGLTTAYDWAGRYPGATLGIGAGVGAVGAGLGAYALHRHMKKKRLAQEAEAAKMSSFDTLAARVALDKLAANGTWNMDEAVRRLDAALTLGVSETTKVASAGSFEQGVETRALELLQAVGYPVRWNN